MKKILEVFGEPLSYGGQEAFILNMYKNFSDNNEFTFFTPFYCDNANLIEETNNNGDKIFSYNKEFNSKLRKKYFIEEFDRFLKKNKDFDIVHIHSGSIFVLAYGSKIAAKNKIKKIIVHSHATGVEGIRHDLAKKMYSNTLVKYPTDYYSCSFEAAKWMFPKCIINTKKFKVIKNGIEIEKYKFNKSVRDKYRKQFDIENDTVLINVGRCSYEKNQKFIIETMNELVNVLKYENIKLIIVGDGEKRFELQDKVKEYGLINKVIFLSKRDDVNNLLSAADLFVFPSNYEGLGIVAIEAQTSGLITLCSDKIPDETNVTSLFKRLKLNEKASGWAREILKLKELKIVRTNRKYIVDIKNAGYDIKESAKILEELYSE